MTMAARGFDFDMANGQKDVASGGKWQVDATWSTASVLGVNRIAVAAGAAAACGKRASTRT